MKKFAIAALLGLTFTGAAFAADEAEVARSQPVTTLRLEPVVPAEQSDAAKVQALIGLFNQELEATMRQLRLLQELRESYMRNVGFALQMSTYMVSVDEVTAAKDAARRRDLEIAADIDRLYQRIGQIGEQKRALLDRAVEMLTPR
jgi:ABC-type molybdenum transport system ATPase subunit/photorepair protein PhrA